MVMKTFDGPKVIADELEYTHLVFRLAVTVARRLQGSKEDIFPLDVPFAESRVRLSVELL
jgi:hypothetical protein